MAAQDCSLTMRFENQSAIVTGAGRGIGHAIAVRLASEGARVACVSRSKDNAKRTADEINILRADSAKHYAVDVADHAAVQKIGAQILEDFTKIDILVNNAGVRRDGLAMRMSIEDWDAVINTNLRGAFNFTQAIIRAMVKQRRSCISRVGRGELHHRPGDLCGRWNSNVVTQRLPRVLPAGSRLKAKSRIAHSTPQTRSFPPIGSRLRRSDARHSFASSVARGRH